MLLQSIITHSFNVSVKFAKKINQPVEKSNRKCPKLKVKMQWIIALMISAVITPATGVVNYCGAKMCMFTDTHTFCAYQPGPSIQCMGYISAPLSNEEKYRIIDRLNRRRNDVANGRLRGMPTAGNMLKLHWMEELAREAQLWADQCEVPRMPEKQDVCRDLYTITVGQSVASVVGEAPGLRVESMIDVWYMQNLYYKGNVTSYEPPSGNSSYYGDFAQMIWARVYLVGCGRSKFMISWQGRLHSVERLVCNFAPRGPPAYRALWSPALPTTVCPPRSRQDVEYTALCDLQRILNDASDMDDALTLEEHIQLNTVMEVENNQSLHYQGGLDELYLTKLAVATMENEDMTTPFYNSLQKRDIAQAIGKELGIIVNKTEFKLMQALGAVTDVPSIREYTQSASLNTRTVKFIGRPKSYNLEELNEVDNHDKDENVHETPPNEDASKESEPYGEYEYQDLNDDNLTATLGVELLTESIRNDVIEITKIDKSEVIKEVDTTRTVTISSTDLTIAATDASEIALFDNWNTSTIMNQTSFADNNSILIDQKVDDYLSDPDTVREIQEALDRMEHSMAETTTAVSHAIKVRRELRDKTEHDDDRSVISNEERNRSLDKTPMINMVLRYMPYLKQYENTIMQRATSKSPSANSFHYVNLMLVSFVCVI